jgi:ribosomal protein L40E
MKICKHCGSTDRTVSQQCRPCSNKKNNLRDKLARAEKHNPKPWEPVVVALLHRRWAA